jgi:RNA polymerase sigma-70 factor (ECF subfamily)
MNLDPQRTSGEPEDDQDLLRAAQGGNQDAFSELVRRHQRVVYRVAYALTRNRTDADDLTQETFVRAYQAIGRFRIGEPMRPWLARITTNLAYSLFRYRRRRPETPLEPMVDAGHQWGTADNPEDHAVAAERDGRLQDAFAQLKPEHQTILALRVSEDMSYEAIAATLHVPVGTVMSRLSRARAELRARMSEESS